MSIDQLPPEILARTFFFLRVSDRVKLASCSKTTQRRVYRQCSEIWETISFHGHTTGDDRLTDYQLSKLLVRVNAREITKALNLSFLSNIHGQGLAPLRYSRVLERIDIVGTGAENNPMPILQTLRTMIPYALHEVILSVMVEGNEAEKQVFYDFFRTLREVRLEQAKEIHCSSCNLPIAEETQQLVLNKFGNSSIRCFQCNQNFCKRASCPQSFHQCQVCTESFCGDCNYSFQCYTCGSNQCKDCRVGDSCDECSQYKCEKCEEMENCECCRRSLCNDCRPRRGECGHSRCKSCDDNGLCGICGIHHCTKCVCVYTCSGCSKRICEKSSCREHAKSCKACVATFCDYCKVFEQCNQCGQIFCNDHNRFVDCKSCKSRHCRPCGRRKAGCHLCGVACYEDCACGNGENPAAKRAKLS